MDIFGLFIGIVIGLIVGWLLPRENNFVQQVSSVDGNKLVVITNDKQVWFFHTDKQVWVRSIDMPSTRSS